MSDKIKAKVKELLEAGEVKGFLGLRSMNGHIGPYLFVDSSDLDDLVLGDRERPGDARYPLNKQLIHLARCYPEESFGVLVRGCDERGLKTLFTWNQLDPGKVVAVGIACPQELAEACECLKPYPDDFVEGESKDTPLILLLRSIPWNWPVGWSTGWPSLPSASSVTVAGTSVPCASVRNALWKMTISSIRVIYRRRIPSFI